MIYAATAVRTAAYSLGAWLCAKWLVSKERPLSPESPVIPAQVQQAID
jgi:hypothetical protein